MFLVLDRDGWYFLAYLWDAARFLGNSSDCSLASDVSSDSSDSSDSSSSSEADSYRARFLGILRGRSLFLFRRLDLLAFLDLEDLRCTGDSSSDSVSSYLLGGLEGRLAGDFFGEFLLVEATGTCRLREAKGISSSSEETLVFFLVARLTNGSSSSDSSLTTTLVLVAAFRAKGTSSSSLSS